MADVELLNTTDDVAEFEHQVTKKGLPGWLGLLPILALVVIGLLATQRGGDPAEESTPTTLADGALEESSDPAASDSESDDDSPGSSFEDLRIRGNESERLGLIHGTHEYETSTFGGALLDGPQVIALRAGSDLLVISSEEELAHRIQLPRGSTVPEPGDSSIALVLDKLIISDGALLRSLSVQGGVDLVLATGLVGFQVDGPRLVVAAETSDVRFDTKKIVDIRVQGVHADFFGVPGELTVADGARVVLVDGQMFVEFAGQVLVPSEGSLVPLYLGSVVAAGPNHALIRNCTIAEPTSTEPICEAVRVRLDGTEVTPFDPLSGFGATELVLSPTGDQLLVLEDGSPNQRLLELVDGFWEETQSFEGFDFQDGAFSSDGSLLATVANNQVDFWVDGELVESWTVGDFPAITEISVGS